MKSLMFAVTFFTFTLSVQDEAKPTYVIFWNFDGTLTDSIDRKLRMINWETPYFAKNMMETLHHFQKRGFHQYVLTDDTGITLKSCDRIVRDYPDYPEVLMPLGEYFAKNQDKDHEWRKDVVKYFVRDLKINKNIDKMPLGEYFAKIQDKDHEWRKDPKINKKIDNAEKAFDSSTGENRYVGDEFCSFFKKIFSWTDRFGPQERIPWWPRWKKETIQTVVQDQNYDINNVFFIDDDVLAIKIVREIDGLPEHNAIYKPIQKLLMVEKAILICSLGKCCSDDSFECLKKLIDDKIDEIEVLPATRL